MEYYGHSSLEENGMIIYFPTDIKRHKNGNSSEVFKLTFIYFSSYPLVLVLPKDILDENLKKVAPCHKLQRKVFNKIKFLIIIKFSLFKVSAIVWRYPRAKSLLLSGSSFCNKCCINLVVKEPQPNSSSSSNTNNCSSYLVVSYICFPSNVIDCFSPAHQLSKTYVHISCCD
ncbi:unnamed protein product [Rotaria socialis]|uniref:Uncharacterized protein n=1 Tax=Rotaria socialis TaxID=392032 RepID=A0A817RE48_9BILA|nr:unnamed protein product [Rotaria socialis]